MASTMSAYDHIRNQPMSLCMCYILLLPDRHRLNDLFSRTIWVSRHQKG